jgi:lactate dehydrogenase-like 2-hydroxyacid dehydrogenase
LLGSVSGELGLRTYLEGNGHELVVTSSKDGVDSVLDRELPSAEIVISQPFWPAYMTAERFARAPNLKLVVTAGVGSDHTDLQAAAAHGVTVAEVTYCNSNSVAEHVVMMTLALVRNYIPSYNWVVSGGWNIADCVAREYDLEGMHFGTVAAGRIGLRVLRLLKPFDVKLHYLDRHRLPETVERELNVTHHESLESLTRVCDVVSLNCPLHPETEFMINERSLAAFKRGAYLINTARGKPCDANLDKAVPAIVGSIVQNSGQICFAGTRVLVEESMRSELVSAVAQAMEHVRVGSWYESVDMGPLINAKQEERVLKYLSIGHDEGAQLVTGGHKLVGSAFDRGFFIEPTLFDHVTSDMRIAREEIFGPVLSVLSFNDPDQAVEIANSTDYGLAASVWTNDLRAAVRMARSIQAGQVYINTYGFGGVIGAPFGGYKKSGFGRTVAWDTILEYTLVKSVIVNSND